MINKKELRPGSRVLYVEDGGYDESELYVLAISPDNAELANSHSIYTHVRWESIHPLDIYPWHLEEARFNKITKDTYQLNGWEIDLKTHTLTWKVAYVFHEVKYVHQLQNLVFKIDGIEILPIPDIDAV